MLSAMLVNNFHLAKVVGVEDYTNVDAIRAYVAVHPDKWEQIQHGWILCQIQDRHQVLRMAEPILADLGKLHCPEEFEANQQKVRDKFNKQEAKFEKRLNELGYGLDGKPLVIREEHNYTDVMKQHKEMKKKHPDAILLFRLGDFYELFEGDAATAAVVLGITLTTKKVNGKSVQIAGFPHHSLDKYLPKLVRAGKRVAICEQLNDPKK